VAFITPGPPREREAWLAYLAEKHRLSRRPVSAGIAAAGELRAGTAKISITPDDIKMPVHDPCYARSLVLDVGGERIGLVAVDLATYSNERLVAACRERFGLSHLMLSSSHTHSAPGRGNGDFFEERITRVLEAAVKDMAPSRISAGHRSVSPLSSLDVDLMVLTPRPACHRPGRAALGPASGGRGVRSATARYRSA
jgi:hypothetical protein